VYIYTELDKAWTSWTMLSVTVSSPVTIATDSFDTKHFQIINKSCLILASWSHIIPATV